MKQIKWRKNIMAGNYVLNFKGGYISYNPNTVYSASINPSLGLLEMVGNLHGMPSGEETALYLKKDDSFRILTGDFRKEYEHCKTIKERLAVFNKNSDKENAWSNYK